MVETAPWFFLDGPGKKDLGIMPGLPGLVYGVLLLKFKSSQKSTAANDMPFAARMSRSD